MEEPTTPTEPEPTEPAPEPAPDGGEEGTEDGEGSESAS